jgi:hypothetical protein
MQPCYIALILWGLSACAFFGIIRSLSTGAATSTFTYRVNQSPVAFVTVILGRFFLIGLAVAETLYAFGLTGDPIAALQSIMPSQLLRAG